MNTEIGHLESDVTRLDQDTIRTNRSLLVLTRWIAILTIVMIAVGIIQLIVMWPKRTYCISVSGKVQICEPDYYPYDKNPASAAYQLDQKYGERI